jgi:hypothetical protein
MKPVWSRIRAEWRTRPWWMNLLLGVCLYMTFFYVPRDFFVTPIDVDQEVWFGILLHGIAAKLTEPLHWAIYAAGAYGFWKMRPWMWPWAALYVAQVAVGTAVWNLTGPRGNGAMGALVALVILVPAIALWRSRRAFATSTAV